MSEFNSKKYFIKTFGCQANIADSNTMSGILESLSYERYVTNKSDTEDSQFEDALINSDLIIINTCSVRQKSEDKVYGMGKVIKKVMDEKGKKPAIVLSGCMVGSVTGDRQRYAFEELAKKTPWADIYMNPSEVFNLPSKLLEKNLLDEWAVQKYNPAEVIASQDTPRQAFVNISYGCDNFCTFCVVPYARGAETSRTEAEILKEINHLVGRGFTQITLCGQNVNSWGLPTTVKFEIRTGSDQKLPFADLLRKVCAIEKLEKVSFLSSNPFDFTTDLIDAIKNPKVSSYLHIAVQSGNNEILKKMNRRHTVESFVDLTEKIKAARPDVEFGTDIIVGFPSETEDQFNDTIKLVERVKFNVAYIAMYSPRKGTPAQRFYKDDVPLKEKKRRHTLLTKIYREQKPAAKI